MNCDECEQKKRTMYDYLSTSFKDLFDNDGSIRNFEVSYAIYLMSGHYEQVNTQYGTDIHDAILPWIHEEYNSGCLLKKEWWSHFHDPLCYTRVFCGYRKLFTYRNFTLQLIMVDKLYDTTYPLPLEQHICFEAALYGIDNHVKMDSNNMMIHKHWNSK